MLRLPCPSKQLSSAQIHPLALFAILDAYTRRSEGTTRVIGTLLGRKVDSVGSSEKSVEITNAFAIPYKEMDGKLAMGKEFQTNMLALHQKVCKNEVVLGWFSASSDGEMIVDSSSLVQAHYASIVADSQDAIHLVVDTSLKSDSLSLAAYVCTPLEACGHQLCNMFQEIKLTTAFTDSEKIFVDSLVKTNNVEGSPVGVGSNDESPDNVTSLESSLAKLSDLLERAGKYMDDVAEGKVEANNEVGRRIADAIGEMPNIPPEVFDKLFNSNLQDMLSVMYLSDLTKTQLAISEKLTKTLTLS